MMAHTVHDQLLLQFGERLRVLTKQLRAHYDERYVCITPALDQVLVLIATGKVATLSQVACALLVSPGAATQHIAALEKEGAVERIPGTQDRREIQVRLTPRGQELYEAVYVKRLELLKHLFGGLSPDELQTLSGLIEKATAGHDTES